MSINRKLAIHIFIKGRVQGVSFCYFTLKQAQNLHIGGWVRNNPNGNVEDVAKGDKTKSYLFTAGAIYYRVNDMKLIWEHAGRIIQIFPLSNKCNSKYIPIFTDWREKKID